MRHAYGYDPQKGAHPSSPINPSLVAATCDMKPPPVSGEIETKPRQRGGRSVRLGELDCGRGAIDGDDSISEDLALQSHD